MFRADLVRAASTFQTFSAACLAPEENRISLHPSFMRPLLPLQAYEFARRPWPAEPQPDSFRRPRTTQCRHESLAIIARNQRKPKVIAALSPRPPFAHNAGRDIL